MLSDPISSRFLLQLQQVLGNRVGAGRIHPSTLGLFENINQGANLCLKLRQSMKNSRKIFKFLKFLEQIASIVKNIESKKPYYVKLVAIL